MQKASCYEPYYIHAQAANEVAHKQRASTA